MTAPVARTASTRIQTVTRHRRLGPWEAAATVRATAAPAASRPMDAFQYQAT
jgi:hypothetical protein